MPVLCRGEFSEETKKLLRDDKSGNAYLRQPCATCGTYVVAENKGGEWFPKNHPKPGKRRPFKSGGYKR